MPAFKGEIVIEKKNCPDIVIKNITSFIKVPKLYLK